MFLLHALCVCWHACVDLYMCSCTVHVDGADAMKLRCRWINMIPANIQGLTFARSPQMVWLLFLLAVVCSHVCFKLSICTSGPSEVVLFQLRWRPFANDLRDAQNINILTIGSPDGIGGFFPKVKTSQLLQCCAVSCHMCPGAPVAAACSKTVWLGLLGLVQPEPTFRPLAVAGPKWSDQDP